MSLKQSDGSGLSIMLFSIAKMRRRKTTDERQRMQSLCGTSRPRQVIGYVQMQSP